MSVPSRPSIGPVRLSACPPLRLSASVPLSLRDVLLVRRVTRVMLDIAPALTWISSHFWDTYKSLLQFLIRITFPLACFPSVFCVRACVCVCVSLGSSFYSRYSLPISDRAGDQVQLISVHSPITDHPSTSSSPSHGSCLTAFNRYTWL